MLDIEGTTTPVAFVYEVLFPYARNRVREFLQQHREHLGIEIQGLSEEHRRDQQQGLNPPPWQDTPLDSHLESIATYVGWLIDRDRKSPALKSLQGKVWERGYQCGELCGQVYADVPLAFARWRRQGRCVCIFSSGSVLAQKLLFSNSTAGDLTPYITGYFDTSAGAKTNQHSYEKIANSLQRPAATVAFVSDVAAELDAAQLAGMHTIFCVRAGHLAPHTARHSIIHTFDEIFP